MNQIEFIEITANIEDFFNKQLSKNQKKEWYLALKDFSAEDYLKATREFYRQNKFMPQLSEMLEKIKNASKEDDYAKYYINNQWCKVYF